MSDQIFYVGAQDRKNREKVTGFVPAKFLMRRGRYVMDPMLGGSQEAFLYSDAVGNDKTNGRTANPYNYLIVPDVHTERKAKDFAAQIAGTWRNVPGDEAGGALALIQALLGMKAAFGQGGSQDIQRNPQWGIPKNSFVPAFIGSASDHLGYVAALSGLPKALVEIAGGYINERNADNQRPDEPRIDTGGPRGLSWHNYHNITQGFSDGLAASEPLSPFNDYGSGLQLRRPADQIGDGNGVAGWEYSLSGIDPQEPTPPAWPPLTDRPIRYLSRWTQ